MERFWRTMREQALDHIGQVASLDDIEKKLRAWLTRYYLTAPHAGLLGRTPTAAFAEGEKVRVSESELRDALTVRVRRRVRRDTTVSLGGVDYEIPLGYLAGQIVTIATSLYDDADPFLELEGKRIPLRTVDPVANAKRRRPPCHPRAERPNHPVDFDPGCTLIEEEDADVER